MEDLIKERIRNGKAGLLRELPFLLLTLPVGVITVLGLFYPPVLASQGQAHRIFYTHVAIAWVALYAPLFAAVSGLLYLFTRKERFDVWSLANTRLAFLFSIGVLISGMLWAKITWGTFWNWHDSRLISFFVLCLCLGGYFIVRYLTDHPRNRAVYSSLMAILAAFAAVLTWYAIRLIKPDLHPTSVIGTMHPRIRAVFWLSILAYHFAFIVMLRVAVRQEYISRIRNRFSVKMEH